MLPEVETVPENDVEPESAASMSLEDRFEILVRWCANNIGGDAMLREIYPERYDESDKS